MPVCDGDMIETKFAQNTVRSVSTRHQTDTGSGSKSQRIESASPREGRSGPTVQLDALGTVPKVHDNSV